ncbi:MAG: DNA mismatch repair endonuclease MutL, partial [Desulfosporosinus sp.]
MTAAIHILDTHSANQIAAGEVVERPASVVKELVENALDAEAKHIDITIEGNGVPLMRVRDDGWGIALEDLPLAVIRHATSKISRIADLEHLQTLGFRGEALPSIASVSQLEISSRPADEVVGLCLKLKGGEQGEFSEVGCPVGTSVTVRNLFFNTPARLKFLKSIPTEFGLISDTIGRIALAHPNISFTLTHPQQVVLQTSGRGDLRETIGSILGHVIARQLIPINTQQGDWQLEGFISPPELVRSSKQTQTFMINGRIIRSPFLSSNLEEGYHTLIPTKLHPVVVLHLHIPPSEYDVNVHPTKMDVRFKNEKSLASFISQAVYQTLIKSKPLPSFQTQRTATQFLATHETKTASPLNNSPLSVAAVLLGNAKTREQFPEPGAPLTVSTPENKTLNPETFDQPKFFLPSQEQVGILESSECNVPSQEASAKSSVQVDPLTPNSLPGEGDPLAEDILTHIWPLAQLFNTYILATDGEVLLMIDQHAAHERINYEQLLAEFRQAEHASQALLIPLPLEFTLQEEQVVLENLWNLTEMGFILEQFGDRTYLLRGVPVHTGTVQADKLLRQFIEEVLQKNSSPTIENLLEEWIFLLACKESIKGQESLSLLEMEQLIAQLNQTHNPYTCPHGRPTMVKMT